MWSKTCHILAQSCITCKNKFALLDQSEKKTQSLQSIFKWITRTIYVTNLTRKVKDTSKTIKATEKWNCPLLYGYICKDSKKRPVCKTGMALSMAHTRFDDAWISLRWLSQLIKSINEFWTIKKNYNYFVIYEEYFHLISMNCHLLTRCSEVVFIVIYKCFLMFSSISLLER